MSCRLVTSCSRARRPPGTIWHVRHDGLPKVVLPDSAAPLSSVQVRDQLLSRTNWQNAMLHDVPMTVSRVLPAMPSVSLLSEPNFRELIL